MHYLRQQSRLRIPMRGYEEQEKAKDAIKDALRIPMRGYEISVEQ